MTQEIIDLHFKMVKSLTDYIDVLHDKIRELDRENYDLKQRLTKRAVDVLPCGHPKTCSIRIKGGEPHCEICGEPANAANA